jgi:hypothetical protein
MVFTGYLDLGGREIVNADRTYTYVSLLLPTLGVQQLDDCTGLYEALGHKAYTSPLVDQPSWFDPDNPDTWDFYGLYPLTFEGFEDATTTAAVTEFIYDGGAVSPPRRGTRSMRITGLLIGLDTAAVVAGMTWLRNVLRPGGCGVNQACSGDHLSYFSSCPPLCEDAPDLEQGFDEVRECATGAVLSPISMCALPYERHLYNSVVVDGPRIVEEFDLTCGAMVRVEFTIVAGVPSPFGTARQVTDLAVIPAELPTVADFPCDANSEGTLVQRTNAAPNPGPTITQGWSSLDPAYWNNTWTTTQVHTPGGRSSKSQRWTEGGWAPQALGGAGFIGAYTPTSPAPLTSAMPAITPGLTYTVSLWMMPSTEARGYIDVQPVNANGDNVGPASFTASDLAAALTWVRGSVTLIPPAGSTHLRISARMEVAFPAIALFDGYALFTEALVEAATGPATYFDGSSTSSDPTITYSWFGVTGKSASRQVQTITAGPIVDPDCPPIPSPPRPPAIIESCISDVDEYKRFTVPIAADLVPRWSDLVPIVNLTTGPEAVRQLRVRFYSNPSGRPVYELVQCDFVGEFIVSYLPPNSTMTIDGTAQEVVVVGETGLPQAASHLLYGSGGGPMVWPFMSCGSQYDLAVDIDPSATGLQFELCVAARE